VSYFGDVQLAHSSALGELVLAHHRPSSCLDPHQHEASYVSLCLDGSYLEDVGGLVEEVTRGDVFVHPVGEAHANDMASRGATILNLRVSAPIQRLYNASQVHGTRAKLTCSGEFVRQIETIFSGNLECEWLYQLLGTADIILPLLVPGGGVGRGEDRLDKVIAAIEMNLDQSWSLSDLASIAGYHPVYFGQKFKERFGYPPGDHVRRMRMRAALRLMCLEGLTATESAHLVGFFDSAHMAHTFRKALGVSPSSFRKAALSS